MSVPTSGFDAADARPGPTPSGRSRSEPSRSECSQSGLELIQLAVGYTDPLVAGITLKVAPGEIVALIGASGSGKSTVLRTIVGAIPALSGRILLNGREVTSAPIHQRRIGIVFQEPLLFGHLDVLENIAYGPRRHGASRRQSRDRALEFLDWVGLRELAASPVSQLSGGQAQRVALARALAVEPAALLMDEPFSALDADLRTRLSTEVAGWLRERGISTLHVTHDRSEAAAMADRVFAIQPGNPGNLIEPDTPAI